VVTTIAGPAPPSTVFGTSDGTNNSARFHSPYGIAVDSATNLYVADTGNNTVRKIAPIGTNWVVTTLAGSPGSSGSANGSNSVARFNNPSAVAVDSTGLLYVADFANSCIRKITQIGTNWAVTTLAGTNIPGWADGSGTAARFNGPQCVAVDSAQHVFVTDSTNCCIRRISPTGVVTTIAGTPGVTGTSDGTGGAAHLTQAYGIGVDSSGTVFVADYLGYAVRQGQLAPVLQIGRNGQQVVVSWPNGLTGFGLRRTPIFTPPSWSDISTGIALLGDWWELTNASPGFYRLRHP